MPDGFTHLRENNDDTEQHLSENRDKFESDAMFLLKQMLRGEVLTAKTVVQKYGVADRRLRDLENEGKCKKRWKLNDDGKRQYVEYYCEVGKLPTKQSLQEFWNEYQEEKEKPKFIQPELFK
jgi:predicted DNA-binding ArsR family transcriptional regulator